MLNGELVYVTKVKRDQSNKFQWVTFTNLATQNEATIKDDLFIGAVCVLNNTDVFKMFMHFNNFKDKDFKYACGVSEQIINSLKFYKVELHGSGKLEEYDFNKIIEILKYPYSQQAAVGYIVDMDSFIHEIDGGYTYNYVYDNDQREKFDRNAEVWAIFQAEIQKEVDAEVMAEIVKHAQKLGEVNESN